MSRLTLNRLPEDEVDPALCRRWGCLQCNARISEEQWFKNWNACTECGAREGVFVYWQCGACKGYLKWHDEDADCKYCTRVRRDAVAIAEQHIKDEAARSANRAARHEADREKRRQAEQEFFSGVKDVRREREQALKRRDAEIAKAIRAERQKHLEAQAIEIERRRQADARKRRAVNPSLKTHMCDEDCWRSSYDMTPVSLGVIDGFYAAETFLVRRSAADNRAYGWRRPKHDRWAEGHRSAR